MAELKSATEILKVDTQSFFFPFTDSDVFVTGSILMKTHDGFMHPSLLAFESIWRHKR